MATERIFIEVGSQVLQIATETLDNQEIYPLNYMQRGNEYSCKAKSSIKLLDPYNFRGIRHNRQ